MDYERNFVTDYSNFAQIPIHRDPQQYVYDWSVSLMKTTARTPTYSLESPPHTYSTMQDCSLDGNAYFVDQIDLTQNSSPENNSMWTIGSDQGETSTDSVTVDLDDVQDSVASFDATLSMRSSLLTTRGAGDDDSHNVDADEAHPGVTRPQSCSTPLPIHRPPKLNRIPDSRDNQVYRSRSRYDGTIDAKRSHAQVERRYRENINTLILQLQEALVRAQDRTRDSTLKCNSRTYSRYRWLKGPGMPARKAEVLAEAISFIDELDVEIRHIRDEIAMLRHEPRDNL